MRRHWYAYVVDADPSRVMKEGIINRNICLFVIIERKKPPAHL